MRKVNTEKAPAAVGPYSQATVSKGLVYTSGQIPLDPAEGKIVGEDITAQAHQALRNLSEVLKASGSDLKSVIKTTCFIADMDDFAAFNQVYEQYFTEKPARSCVAVKTLPKNALCEIEAIAEAENK